MPVEATNWGTWKSSSWSVQQASSPASVYSSLAYKSSRSKSDSLYWFNPSLSNSSNPSELPVSPESKKSATTSGFNWISSADRRHVNVKIVKLLAPLINCQNSGERRPNDWLIVHLSHNGNETQRSTRVEWGKIVIWSYFFMGGGVQGKLKLLHTGGYWWFRCWWVKFELLSHERTIF